MYLRARNRGAHDQFWQLVRDGLRDHGLDAPDALTDTTDLMGAWDRPDLIFAQICCLPLRAAYLDRLHMIGSSDYGLAECAAGYYFSWFVVRNDDDDAVKAYFDRTLAINELLSQSGHGAPQTWARAHGGQFNYVAETGAHFDSAHAVADGRADIAAIDAVTWQMLGRFDEQPSGIKIIGRTIATPCQPLVTANVDYVAPLQAVIPAALSAMTEQARGDLGLVSLADVTTAACADLPLPPTPKTTRNITAEFR